MPQEEDTRIERRLSQEIGMRDRVSELLPRVAILLRVRIGNPSSVRVSHSPRQQKAEATPSSRSALLRIMPLKSDPQAPVRGMCPSWVTERAGGAEQHMDG